MDLDDLHIFLTVVREGGITRAAEKLHRVQSNVTTRIRQLEENLGVALFLREGKRLIPSPAGRVLEDYARRLLELAAEARSAVADRVPRGRLRVGAMESTAAARLAPVLAEFHEAYDGVQLELRTGATSRLVAEVIDGTLDCALVAWPPPGLDEEAPVQRTPVWTESLLLALPASHPPVETPADLRVHTLAAFAHGCTYRRIGEDWMRQATGQAPQVLELASYPAILACVAGGRCAGVVPEAVVDLLHTPPALRWVPLGPCDTVLVHRTGYATPALAALQAALHGAQDTPSVLAPNSSLRS